jgi:hypothetical protein
MEHSDAVTAAAHRIAGSRHGQSSQGSNGGKRRYQKGSLFLRGKNPVWVGRWLEDVEQDGKITRLHKSEVIGTKKDIPSKRLAQRELDIRLSRINQTDYIGMVDPIADIIDEETKATELRQVIIDYLEWGAMTSSDRDMFAFKFEKLTGVKQKKD